MNKSKQLNFFIIPEDLKAIESFFKEKGCLVMRNNTTSNSISVDYNIVSNAEKVFQIFLTKEEFKNNIDLNHLKSKDCFYVEETSSYVIEFGIGGFYPYSDKELHRSRFYFICEYYKEGQLVQKSPEFIHWADELIKEFKKYFLIKFSGYSNDFFTKQCVDWVKMNNAILAPGGQKITIK